MLRSHKLVLAAGVAIFLLGIVLVVVRRPSMELPPALTAATPDSKTQAPNPSMSVEALSGPWFRRAPAAAAVAPKSAPPAVHPDTTSVKYLGSSTDRSGTQTFFFKQVSSDQVIILKLGETRNGWTLKELSERTFTLLGSGGPYEVER